MLLVIASRTDAAAAAFAQQRKSLGFMRLTPNDICQEGWSWDSELRLEGKSGGRYWSSSELAGVLMRIPSVVPDELLSIANEDAAYVAAELNAFLLAFLTSLSCPVLNAPTAQALSGPGWGAEQWQFAAAASGFRVEPRRQLRRPGTSVGRLNTLRFRNAAPDIHCVSVIGFETIGHDCYAEQARSLARLAQVSMLSIWLRGDTYVDAQPWPDLGDRRIGSAIARLFPTSMEQS